MLLLLTGLLICQLDLAQSELQVIIDNIDLEVEEEYYEYCKATPCENDDMVAMFSLDCKIKKTLPIEGSLKAVLLQVVNGEPTEPTGVDMDLSLDQMVNDTVIVGPLLTAMNIPHVWPFEPMLMYIECYVPPMDNLPDFFPPGEYQFKFHIEHDDTHLFTLALYLTLF